MVLVPSIVGEDVALKFAGRYLNGRSIRRHAKKFSLTSVERPGSI